MIPSGFFTKHDKHRAEGWQSQLHFGTSFDLAKYGQFSSLARIGHPQFRHSAEHSKHTIGDFPAVPFVAHEIDVVVAHTAVDIIQFALAVSSCEREVRTDSARLQDVA